MQSSSQLEILSIKRKEDEIKREAARIEAENERRWQAKE